jgi:hypothetical protein
VLVHCFLIGGVAFGECVSGVVLVVDVFMIAQEILWERWLDGHRLRVYIGCQSRFRTEEELHHEEIDR